MVGWEMGLLENGGLSLKAVPTGRSGGGGGGSGSGASQAVSASNAPGASMHFERRGD